MRSPKNKTCHSPNVTELDRDVVPIHERSGYRQGAQDYQRSVRDNRLSISKSHYNPPAESSEAYQAGWEHAAAIHHRKLTRRDGLRTIIMGIVLVAFGGGGMIFIVAAAMSDLDEGHFLILKDAERVMLLAAALFGGGLYLIRLGLRTLRPSKRDAESEARSEFDDDFAE